jgi:hypothetical protein
MIFDCRSLTSSYHLLIDELARLWLLPCLDNVAGGERRGVSPPV